MLIFSLGQKPWIHGYAELGGGGALKCHERPEQELLVLRSEMNAAPRPEGAQSALGRRPQAVAFLPAHSPKPNPNESWLFPGGLLQAPRGEEPSSLGWALPTRPFLRAGAQMLARRGAAPSLRAGGVGGGPRAPGGGGGTSLSLKSAAGPSARCTRRAGAEAPLSYTHGPGLWGRWGKRARESRDSGRTRNRSAQKKKSEPKSQPSGPRQSRNASKRW